MNTAQDVRANHYPLRKDLQIGAEALKIVSRTVRDTLNRAGYHQIDDRDHTQREERDRIPLDASSDLGPAITIHRRWRWDVEWIDAEWWLVPLPSYRFLVEAESEALKRLSAIVDGAIHVFRFDGTRGRIEREGRQWTVIAGRKQFKISESNWFATLETETLEQMGYAGRAYQANQLHFGRAANAVKRSPFAPLIRDVRPRAIPQGRALVCTGKRLVFARDVSDQMKHLFRFKVKVPPAEPIAIATCHEKYAKDTDKRSLRDRWLCMLLPKDRMKKERRKYPHLCEPHILDVWQRIGMPPYSIPRGSAVEYDAATGIVPENEVKRLAAARGESTRLVTVAFVGEHVVGQVFRSIPDNFRNLGRTLMLRPETLGGNANSFANVAADLAHKAGARLWDLDLPAAPEGTYFLGYDSGQVPSRDRQKAAFTLVDRAGHMVGHPFEIDLQGRSERAGSEILRDDVKNWLRRSARDLARLIVHRDGNFFPGEDEAFVDLANSLPVSLVAVRKRPASRFSPAAAGFWWQVDSDRAFLVTNDQASAGGGRPTPIELHLVRSAGLTLDDAVAQVFWLTYAFTGSLFHPRRVPLTISASDSYAATGIAVGVRRHI